MDEIKKLMSGIAVVIDDAFKEDGEGNSDKIVQIVEDIENEWEIPFYKADKIPLDSICYNLLQSAGFILLDWKLWPSGAPELEKIGIESNINFLEKVKDYFVPVFIFTNEDSSVVVNELPDSLYDEDNPEKNFIFVKGKTELTQNGTFDFDPIKKWIEGNASVYTLKTWEQAFYKSKRELFSSMYTKSPDWPKVFWKSYKDDDVDPSSSITRLINDGLLGRIKTDIFEKQFLDSDISGISGEDIKALIAEASFIQKENLPEGEIRTGDLFKLPKRKYLINIRPDCDCVPRNDSQGIDSVELYCIEGKKMTQRDVEKKYKEGHFDERVWESISFAIYEKKTIRFDFKKLHKKNFSEIKTKRVGRLIHPYITRIQQRYALYLQRQGLPRIPEEAVFPHIPEEAINNKKETQ